jgi:acetyl esterase/lipase
MGVAVLLPESASGVGAGDSFTELSLALTPQDLRVRSKDYAAEADPAHHLISPLFGGRTGLPPLLIQVGSHEILLDDATRFAAHAATADVSVTLEVTAEVPHMAAILDEASAALDRAG